MKKILFASVTLFSAIIAFAQPGKNLPVAAKANPHIKAFNLAAASGDINTGIIALNYYIADQGNNTPYADTLAMLYMQQGAYAQCYYWADKRLQAKPEDNSLLEMKGICLDKLQQPKESIAVFEKLFGKTQSPYHAYKLMELQYSIKRLAECVVTANAAERLQYKPEFTMTYNVGEQVGRTYLQAGVYNIHALALYDLDKKAEAKSYFEKAIALDSNFVLARQNLEAIKTIEAGGNKVNPANPPVSSPANKQN
jgi:tetratricopeptide (TPR) repeat protein